MSKQKLVQSITSKDQDFAQWYTDVCLKAELMDYSSVQGFIIYRPYGYAIWEQIQAYLNNKFKETGHENVYLPLVIPESLFQKEKDHIDGFAPETAIITTTGNDNLAERLIVRPTSEVLFAEHYAKIINSHRDLPKLYNQWCSVVRWEKTTRPFLRGKEFLWQEGHTAHATSEEAISETLQMLNIYDNLGKELLAIPFITGQKTEKEKFAGAVNTYTIEALMQDGKALQSGTSHYFGNDFAKAFNIVFQDENNQEKPVYQTSWGVTTRLIGAVIMVHGDDEGLVLPPHLAPIQVVAIPIQNQREEVINHLPKIEEVLKKTNLRYKIDNSTRRPGWKFSEYEMKGVPVRLEFGPRDIENGVVVLAKRNTREKITVKFEDLEKTLVKVINEVHQEMYEKALDHLNSNIRVAKTYDEFKEFLELGGYVKMSVHGEEAEDKVKEDTGATARVISEENLITKVCPVTGKDSNVTILFARAY
ncbi:MAG: proline--tRNA ligase [Acholeplasmataceae bacterium]|nr:proline--tRNA ligase [Acholeplasmataceae bacterium]